MGDLAFHGIGLVLADNAEGLLATVVARELHGVAEADVFRGVCVVHDMRGRAPRLPIAHVACRPRQSVILATVLGLGLDEGVVSARKLSLYLREAFRGDVVRMFGDRPLGQIDRTVPVRL